jgi:hypothetical protein
MGRCLGRQQIASFSFAGTRELEAERYAMLCIVHPSPSDMILNQSPAKQSTPLKACTIWHRVGTCMNQTQTDLEARGNLQVRYI